MGLNIHGWLTADSWSAEPGERSFSINVNVAESCNNCVGSYGDISAEIILRLSPDEVLELGEALMDWHAKMEANDA